MSVIRNVHERTVRASAAAVGALLDRLSSDDDPVFPVPAWSPMRFDRPLGVGATGGHGPVRYSVTAYEPGRRVRFDFTAPDNGFHELTVEPLTDERCRVRHVLEAELRGVKRLRWDAVIRPVHDVMVEELFDNIERLTTGPVADPVRWSPRVRLLNRLGWDRPVAVGFPAGARLVRTAVDWFDEADYRDAYAMELPPGMPLDPVAWEGVLRGIPITDRAEREIVLGQDAGHLDFRASLLVDAEARRVTLSSVVRVHPKARGRLYWAVVSRVHPFMARMMLRRTHRRLALAAPSAAEREVRARAAATG
ncbi:DUF2867 domain-containing protein [Streptomyces sp. NPDC046261]|uniref:DUF2867 domain-containing protein n=1 Tax=Streptomyces sp. NPDC046261 TaxID=3157200 RepID=UPI0033DC3F16